MSQDASPSGNSRRLAPQNPKRKVSLQQLLLGEHKMMPKGSRVSGVYQEGEKFRVVVFCPERQSIWCKTREEADAIAARLAQMFHDQTTRTVGQAVDENLEYRQLAGHRLHFIRNVRAKLLPLLPPDRMLHSITAEVAAELYRNETQRLSRPMAAASHRASLKYARAFFRWLIEDRKYVQLNPFDRVKPVGPEKTGKPQLRLDEARKLNAWLVKQADEDERATAVLTQLILGLRSSEVLRRQVRDVDDNGKLFCIESGKTKNARRWLEIRIPALQRLLAKQAQGRKPDALLFGAHRSSP